MPVTIRDVAKASGVSIGAVSSAINNKGRIGAATRERILATVRTLGYDPDGNLPRRPAVATGTIGLVVPGSITEIHPAYYRAITAAKQATAERGFRFQFYFESEVRRMAVDLFHLGREQLACDGLVLYCPRMRHNEYMRNLAAWNVPMVLVRRQTGLENVTVITNSNRNAVLALQEHLYGLGHRRIICYQSNGEGGLHLQLGEFLRGRNLPFGPESVIRRDRLTFGPDDRKHPVDPRDVTTEYYHSHSGLSGLMRRMLGAAHPPTAVICKQDYLAVEMIKSLEAVGCRVPDDVSVTGMNDDPAALLFEPHITTTHLPAEEMTRKACELLMDPGVEQGRKMVFEDTLVIRESTGKARTADGVGRKA